MNNNSLSNIQNVEQTLAAENLNKELNKLLCTATELPANAAPLKNRIIHFEKQLEDLLGNLPVLLPQASGIWTRQ
jgi:hypothetical protein